MKLQIYGSGCNKCRQLYENAEAAAKLTGNQVELEKITDLNAIVDAGILITPAFAVDGKIISKGKVLSVEEIAALIGAPAPTPCACANPRKSPLKRGLTFLLLGIVAVAIGAAVYREYKASGAPSSARPVSDQVVTVYYFHGNQRCFTCSQIEKSAKLALEQKFAAQLKSGTVVFHPVNLDDPANEHFVRDFGLDSKMIVMQRGKRIEKFPEVWTRIHQPEQFASYLQAGVERLLK